MNTETWLRRALFDLPGPVLEPLRREYLEHLAEAQAGGMDEAEALATLGNPWVVNRELRRMYGGPYLQGAGTFLWVRLMVPLMALPYLYMLLSALFRLRSMFPPDMAELLPSLLALATLAGLWWFTRRLGLRRRLGWQSSGIVFPLFVDGMTHELLRGPGDWHPERLVIYSVLLAVAVGGTCLGDQIPRRIERLTGRPA